MSIFSTLNFIAKHPLNKHKKLDSIKKYFKWQISTAITPYPIIYPLTDKAKLIVKKGMTGATGNYYCGLHEFLDMGFLLHFLNSSDTFMDIGANIGSYTVLASAHIGANTISIEPVPSTFEHLMNNIWLNNIQNKVVTLNIALGSQKGVIPFTSINDTTNHVANLSDKETIEVRLDTMDEILKEKAIPKLIKIDVEGFEAEVLKGGTKTLQNNTLKAIIIELNGSGVKYGFKDDVIHEELLKYNFKPYSYNPVNRELDEIEIYGKDNTLYLRDLDSIRSQIKSAKKIEINSCIF